MLRINTGSIIEMYMHDINRYIYIKYIDVRKFIQNTSYPFQFRICSQFYNAPLNTFDSLHFEDLLLSPLHLTGFKELVQSGSWKIVSTQKISETDKKQHHYKMAWPPNILALFAEVKQWRVLEDLTNINHGKIVPYYRCAHLEYAENLGANHAMLRILIEYFKINQMAVDINKSDWNKFDDVLYDRYVNMPIYTQMPAQFRGMLLPED